MTIRPKTIKAKTIKANTIKANTVTSSTPRAEPAQSQPQTPPESRSRPRSREERVTGRSSIQSVSKTQQVTPPPVPKQTPPNLASLAHNPGAISSQKRIEAQKNVLPVEDIITARIVGNDFSTGETKVKDGSGNIYSVQIGLQNFQATLTRSQGGSAPAVVVGQSVIISRSRSQQGEVNVRLLSIVPLSQSPNDALSAFANQGNVNDLCRPSGTSTITQRPKDRPEDPQEPEEPAPPIEPSPNEPTPEEDPPSKPFGCDPKDDAQWFNGGCPPGTNELGFAQLSSGGTMFLCRGATTPPGDGCPETPDEYGYICVSGNCEYVPFGLYATKAECEANCSNEPVEPEEVPLPTTWSCDPGKGCILDYNGNFSSKAECEAFGCLNEPAPSGTQYTVRMVWTIDLITSCFPETIVQEYRCSGIFNVNTEDPDPTRSSLPVTDGAPFYFSTNNTWAQKISRGGTFVGTQDALGTYLACFNQQLTSPPSFVGYVYANVGASPTCPTL